MTYRVDLLRHRGEIADVDETGLRALVEQYGPLLLAERSDKPNEWAIAGEWLGIGRKPAAPRVKAISAADSLEALAAGIKPAYGRKFYRVEGIGDPVFVYAGDAYYTLGYAAELRGAKLTEIPAPAGYVEPEKPVRKAKGGDATPEPATAA